MVSTIPEFRPVVGKAFVPSFGKSIRLSPACACRFFFLERGCVRSNWQERQSIHGPRFWHDLDSILPGPQCTSNRLISRLKDGSKKTRSLQKGFERIAAIFRAKEVRTSRKLVEEEGVGLQPYNK